MIKRLLAFIMVLLLSIESFAAVVGDNDGAAFITKAEFDSMKNEFQSQINKYNSSIDNKIDGAIAGYLEGIVIKKDPDNLYNYVRSSIGSNLRFLNNFDNEWTVGTSTDTSQVSAVHQRSYNYTKKGDSVEAQNAFYLKGKDTTTIDLRTSTSMSRVPLSSIQAGRFISASNLSPWVTNVWFKPTIANAAKNWTWFVIGPKDLNSNSTTMFISGTGPVQTTGARFLTLGGLQKTTFTYNLIQIKYATTWTMGDGYMSVAVQGENGWDAATVPLKGGGTGGAGIDYGGYGRGPLKNAPTFMDNSGSTDTEIFNCKSADNPFAIVELYDTANLKKWVALYWMNDPSYNAYYMLRGDWITTFPATFITAKYISEVATHVKSQSGAGKAWRYRALPNGNKTITAYCSTLHPSITFNLKYHSYQDKSSASPAANSYSDTTDRSQTVNNAATLGVTSGGTEYNPSSTSTGGYWQQILSVSEVSDPVVFETAQWGSDLSGNIYMVPEKGYTVARNGTLGTTITDGPKIEWTDDGFSQKANAVKNNNVYAMKVNRETLAKTSFENSYLSSVAGETVYVGGGCPVARLNSADETTLKLDFLVKNKANAGTNQSGSVINYKVSNKQFTAGNVSAGAENIATGTVTSNSSGTASVTVNVPEFPAGTTIWVSAYSSTKPHVVEITGITTKLKN